MQREEWSSGSAWLSTQWSLVVTPPYLMYIKSKSWLDFSFVQHILLEHEQRCRSKGTGAGGQLPLPHILAGQLTLFRWEQIIPASDAGTGGGAGGPLAPPIFDRSVNPIPTGEGQIIPTYYYWPPQCFSPSGITELEFTNLLSEFFPWFSRPASSDRFLFCWTKHYLRRLLTTKTNSCN